MPHTQNLCVHGIILFLYIIIFFMRNNFYHENKYLTSFYLSLIANCVQTRVLVESRVHDIIGIVARVEEQRNDEEKKPIRNVI